MMRNWKRAITAALMGLAALAAPKPVLAMTVIDPTNLAQNILQAARSLEQIHNQIRSLENEARMLARNPLNLSPELSRSIAEARRLFAAAEGLAFTLDELSEDLKALYPETWEAFDLDAVRARTSQWLAQDRRSVQAAMAAEAGAVAAIAQMEERLVQALQSSADAQGQTAVGQATNQLLGVNAAELAHIHALLIAEARAANSERMARIAREERALEIQRRAFPAGRTSAPAPARSAF